MSSLWLLLQDAQEGGRALAVKPSRSLGAAESQKFKFSLEPDLEEKDALYRSAKAGGQQAYQLLWREGYVRQEMTARFKLDQPPSNIEGHSGDLLFALATIITAMPNRQGYPAIAATGVLDSRGRVGDVEGISAKLRAALVVLPEGGLVFYPKANRVELDSALLQAARAEGVEFCAVERLDEAAQKLGIEIHKIYLEAPYRGLESFEYKHRAIYFGRQADIDALSKLLPLRQASKRPGLLIVAASGAGKSSLVQAGLIPALEKGPLALPDPLLWSVWRPRDAVGDDEAALARSIRSAWVRDCPELSSLVQTESLPRLAAVLTDAPLGEKNLLWLVDQMEELFTLKFTQAAIAAFADFLRRVQEAHNGQVWPVATLRNDFYPLYQQQPGFLDVYGASGQYDLKPLNTGALDQIIQGPAELADLSFEIRGGISLATKIRDDLAGRADALPLLEFALKSLYAVRDIEQCQMNYLSYEANGGLQGSIGHSAEILFNSKALDNNARAALPLLLWELTDTGGRDSVAATPALLSQFDGNSAALNLIKAFSSQSARLLVCTDTSVRVAHEALLTHWLKAKTIIEDFKRYKALHDRLKIHAELWKNAPSEQASSRLLPAGLPLTEGQDLLTNMKTLFNLNSDVVAFVEASTKAEYDRQEAELQRERARELAEQERERTERERERARELAELERERTEREREKVREQTEFLAQQKQARQARITAVALGVLTIALGGAALKLYDKQQVSVSVKKDLESKVIEMERTLFNLKTCQANAEKISNKVPGLQIIRKTNASDAAEQNLERATAHPDDLNARIDYAKATGVLGSILGEIGSVKESEDQMLKSIGLLEESIAEKPEEWHVRLELAKQKINLTRLYWEAERRQKALPFVQQAIKELDALKALHPNDPEILYELARAYNSRGNLSRELELAGNGESDYQTSIAVATQASETYSDKTEVLKTLSAAEHNLSLIYKDKKDYPKSLQLLDKSQRHAADALELASSQSYHPPALLMDQAMGMVSQARLRDSMKKPDEAKKYWEEAIPIAKKVVNENPAVTRYAWLLADSLKGYAGFLSSRQEYDAARKNYEDAQVILQDIINRTDDRSYYGIALVDVLDSLATFYGGGKGGTPRDENTWRKSVDAMLNAAHRVKDKYPGDAQANFKLAEAYARKAVFEQDTKNAESALENYKDSLEIYTKNVFTGQEPPTSSEVASFLGVSESAIEIANNLNRLDEAKTIKEQAYRIGKSHTTMAGVQSLGGIFGKYGGMLQKQGRDQDAIDANQMQLKIAKPAWEKANWNWWLRQEVGGAYYHLGELYQKTNNLKEEISARQGWLQVWGGPAYGIDTKMYLDYDPSFAKPEDVQKLREVTSKDYGMKRFTIPADFNGIKYPFQVYITNVPWPTDPLADQARWLEEERGGKIPDEIRDSFVRLQKIAHENNVSFTDLVVYALGKNTEENADEKNAKANEETISIIADVVLKEHLNTDRNPAISTDAMGLAIWGYDPVVYFTEKRAALGDAKYFAVWEKSLWFFVSEENRKLFIANPANYAPGFGGYCAYCMGVGHKTHGDPKAWAVHNNKLYLHQSAELRDKWLKDPDTYIKQAESNWAEKAQTRIDHNVDNTVTSKVLALIDKNINKQPDVKTEDATIKLDGQKDGKADENANTEKDKQIKELKAQIELAERDTNKADDLRSKGDLLGALKSYQDSISIIEPLASKASSVSELQAYLADLYYKVGKVFDTQNDRAGTITKWQKSVSLLEDIVSRFPDKAPKYKEKLASVLGNLSFNLLFSKSYQEALSAAHRALELEPSEYWIKTNEAHALLFLNRYDEAKLIYLEQPNKIVSSSGRSFRQAVIDDYSEFRKQGLNHPDMEKIENLLTKNDIPAKPNESGDEYSAY